jgi:hypothetical protein
LLTGLRQPTTGRCCWVGSISTVWSRPAGRARRRCSPVPRESRAERAAGVQPGHGTRVATSPEDWKEFQAICSELGLDPCWRACPRAAADGGRQRMAAVATASVRACSSPGRWMQDLDLRGAGRGASPPWTRRPSSRCWTACCAGRGTLVVVAHL